MTVDELISTYPTLYHMAEADTWESIRTNGLLSTSELLRRWEVADRDRERIEARHRAELVPVTHPALGRATIRDQKPMSDRALKKCLVGMTPDEWYRLLNRRVFFWLTEERLMRLRKARAYHGLKHTILTLDAATFVPAHAAVIELSPINSGSTIFKPQPRGADTFRSISDYPFDHWTSVRSRRDAVVELTVPKMVSDVERFALRVEHMVGDVVTEVLYERKQ